MYFVGRSREIRIITNALDRGENVILSGRFGMGRTSLMRHIAQTCQDRFHFVFVDFSKTPADMVRRLTAALFPISATQQSGPHLRYKYARFQLLNQPLEDLRQHVLVLDNIEKLTMQKRILLRHLVSEERFLFVAITESFLPENQYHELKVALLATCRIALGHLDKPSARAFFRSVSERNGFGWTDERIEMLTVRTNGYPLSMKEIIYAEHNKPQRNV